MFKLLIYLKIFIIPCLFTEQSRHLSRRDHSSESDYLKEPLPVKLTIKTVLNVTECLPMSYLFAIHLYVSNIVLEHGGNVDLGELVLAEDNQKTCLPTSSIPHSHQLLTDGCHPWRKTSRRKQKLSPCSLRKSMTWRVIRKIIVTGGRNTEESGVHVYVIWPVTTSPRGHYKH